MRVLVIEICNFEDFPTGGQLSFVRNMMKAYGDKLSLVGCSTDDTTVGKWVKKTIDGVQYDYFSVLKMGKSSRKPLIPNRIKGYFALKKHVRDILIQEFDLIFIQAPEVLFALPDNVLEKVTIDLPGINNPLSSSRYHFARRFDRMYDKAFLGKLKKVGHIWATACSRDIRELAERSCGILREDDIIQLPTRYDSEIFRPMDKRDCRRSINLEEDARLFVSVGRLNRGKGWPLMLDAVSILSKDGEKTKFLLIGDGEDEDAIKEFSIQNGLGDILIMPGRLSPEDIAVRLNAADVFVMGSEKEGWSTTLVEACACGTPCVVSNFSSAEEMIDDGVNGYIVRRRDPEMFSEMLKAALQLDRTNVIEYNKRFEHLSINKLKDEMDKVFTSVPHTHRTNGRSKTKVRLFSLLFLCALSLQPLRGKGISITTQADFDRIQQIIENAAAEGHKEIRINIGKGVYYFNEKHIKLYRHDWKDIDLSINGNGCSIIAKGHDYKDGEIFEGRYSPSLTFLDYGGRSLDISGKTFTSESLVRVLDKDSGECMVRSDGKLNLSKAECEDIYLRLTQWYRAKTYKVTEIIDGDIHFIADDLQKVSAAGYNVNYDFIYGMKMPRYRIYNLPGCAELNIYAGKISFKDTHEAHVCEASSFLEAAFSSFKSLSVTGLTFNGNCGNEEKNLIGSYHTSCDSFLVDSCTFKNIGSVVFGAQFTDNITVRDCNFKNCLVHVLSFSSTCDSCSVNGNSFSDCGKSLGPWHCITICGDTYHIDNNNICNFGYGGIFVGCTVDMLQGKEPGGIVERNILWHNEEFIGKHEQYTMMDSGAIYVSTCNGDAVVRNNTIRNISGIKDNRGIFLDDGARNVKVYGNTITGIRNSYSIDSRRVTQFETIQRPNNVNNEIYDNIVDSPVRFEGNEKNVSCKIGGLMIIKEKNEKYPNIHTSDVIQTSGHKKFNSIRFNQWKATSQ